MATTQIKDGFNGGSDNQLRVNDDGSINVVTGGSAGNNVNIASVGGNPVTTAIPVTFADGFSNLSPGYPTQVSVGTTSTQLFAANSLRKYAHIFNNSSQPIYLQYSSSAALNQGIKINQGTFFTLEQENLWLGVINAIGLIANQLIDVIECI